MAAFLLLLFFCLVCGTGGYALRRVDRHTVEEENERYYTPDGITSITTVKSCV
jgi:hypothetical protein